MINSDNNRLPDDWVEVPSAQPTTDPMQQYADAIAAIESDGSGGYSALGPVTRNGDRAFGRYQVMGANVPEWTQAALGKSMTPYEFLGDQDAQDAVFRHRFGSYVDKYGNPQDAASAWFTGRPLAAGGSSASDGYITGNTYVNRFNKALGSQQQALALAAPDKSSTVQSFVKNPGPDGDDGWVDVPNENHDGWVDVPTAKPWIQGAKPGMNGQGFGGGDTSTTPPPPTDVPFQFRDNVKGIVKGAVQGLESLPGALPSAYDWLGHKLQSGLEAVGAGDGIKSIAGIPTPGLDLKSWREVQDQADALGASMDKEKAPGLRPIVSLRRAPRRSGYRSGGRSQIRLLPIPRQ
jgi:hypothetical protein